MEPNIQIKLYATLKKFEPDSKDLYPVESGTTIRQLIQQLGIPIEESKLIFINGIKADLDSELFGGERVGIFPPVGGG